MHCLYLLYKLKTGAPKIILHWDPKDLEMALHVHFGWNRGIQISAALNILQ